MRKIIILADYGLDDAAATASILQRSELFDAIDIVAVAGNVPSEISLRNCFSLISNFPNVLDKITVVDTVNIPQASEYLSDIHGNDGMGDVFEHPKEKVKVKTLKFDEWIDTTDGTEKILSLGPMTVTKLLMQKHSTYTPVIMGGCINTPPNFKGYEFNQCLDREAFSYCTKFKHAAITLDTCRTDKLDMRKYEIKGDDIHSRILRADQRLSISRGEEGCYVWDDVAAIFMLYPDRFTLVEETDKDNNRLFNAVYCSQKLYFED